MQMQFITVPAENEYLIRHAAHICQHADQYRRDVNLHLRNNRSRENSQANWSKQLALPATHWRRSNKWSRNSRGIGRRWQYQRCPGSRSWNCKLMQLIASKPKRKQIINFIDSLILNNYIYANYMLSTSGESWWKIFS